jgi:predicted nucleic-acid-binding protein
LALLDAGADVCDGVIAAEGQRLESHVFVSFERRAVRLPPVVGAAAQAPN